MLKTETVLLTGATGLLGRALVETVPSGVRLNCERIDVTCRDLVHEGFSRIEPSLVIHAASIGNVDYCEQYPSEANRVNVTGTENLVMECGKTGTPIVLLSSNAVFDGENPPYAEDDIPCPVNHYGKTKYASEKIAETIDHIIVRSTLMYGWHGPEQRDNAVTWLLARLSLGKEISLVNDTFVNPVYNVQVAETIWKLVSERKRGIFHIAGQDTVNRYQFGLITAEVFGLDQHLILSVGSDAFPGIARRMPNTTFSTMKLQREIGFRPMAVTEGLTIMKNAKHG